MMKNINPVTEERYQFVIWLYSIRSHHGNHYGFLQIHRMMIHFVALLLMMSVACAAPVTSTLQMRALHEIYSSTGGEQWDYDRINLGLSGCEEFLELFGTETGNHLNFTGNHWNFDKNDTSGEYLVDACNNTALGGHFMGLGCTCDATACNVTQLCLNNGGLSGTIPPETNDLTLLTFIDLDSNSLTGKIPPLDELTSLSILFLGSNTFTGKIPPLNALTSLQFLDLDSNTLTGNIPPLNALTSLKGLDMSRNALTGTIPPLSALTSLQLLNLNQNDLTGTIPRLDALTSLLFLWLFNNALTGTIPPLNALMSLQLLDLHKNRLSGTVPVSLCQLTNLQALVLNDNQLSGTLPAAMTGKMTSLQTLLVQNNSLTSGSSGNAFFFSVMCLTETCMSWTCQTMDSQARSLATSTSCYLT
jgi:hypothetical protein